MIFLVLVTTIVFINYNFILGNHNEIAAQVIRYCLSEIILQRVFSKRKLNFSKS